MENRNRMAVDMVVPTPFLMKAKTSAGAKPQSRAIIMGNATKMGMAFILEEIRQ